MPCADCMGIEVTLVLNDNQTYEQTLLYLGKKDSSLKEKGKFNWNKEGNTITLISKNSPSFRVNEGHIVMLGDDGKEVTGPLADKYILKKN
ncbi:MAG TPA: copper resistance protein NlpE [Hanamia sp.]